MPVADILSPWFNDMIDCGLVAELHGFESRRFLDCMLLILQ